MLEIGTTNKTEIEDYESAIDDRTGAILVAHTSNFKVVGFTKEVELLELVNLRSVNIFSLVDLGSGAPDFSDWNNRRVDSILLFKGRCSCSCL